MSRRSSATLTELARRGFAELGEAGRRLDELDRPDLDACFALAADPDQALAALLRLRERAPEPLEAVLDDPDAAERLIRVLGASTGLEAFFLRNPGELAAFAAPLGAALPTAAQLRDDLVAAVGGPGPEGPGGEPARAALRVRYRRHLARIAAWDLIQPSATEALEPVAAALADLAGAALDAALVVARRDAPFPAEQVAATRLAIIGMGKSGARELNYISDVDVIYVAESAAEGSAAEGSADDGSGAGEAVSEQRAVEIATRLAILTARGISELGVEPGLWEVDANLRPEGKKGALVRTLESHLAYYERWASSWEFQALLKARAMAGDLELGRRYVDAVSPKVWASASSREHFVEGVQAMRRRVTEHIPPDEVDVQLKLGPGGLRDIEFTVQLVQLVHGLADEGIRERGTLPALAALVDHGYIGRAEGAEFADEYRFLRVLEHRIQLSRLRRTHLMPADEDALRVLARASGLAPTGAALKERWLAVKTQVRALHERIFYRPLLTAVAAIPEDGLQLTSEQAEARLAAIGFRDPRGALGHIAALTGGVSRRAQIQRTLLPVLLRWFAQGADPDGGLLAFRRISEELGEEPWYLRMLRDSTSGAERLTQVLSGSRFVANLFERIPEAAAWLENDEELRPRPAEVLLQEQRATVARHEWDEEAGSRALRTARRREVLRLALGSMLGTIDIEELGRALADVTTTYLSGALALCHHYGDGIEFGVVAMGRYGGAELGFGSDADVMFVYQDRGAGDEAQSRAQATVRGIQRVTEDIRLPFELDLGLRPEGRNGPVVRSLESYRAYYERWSLSWEAQALLRARTVVGDVGLLGEFRALISDVRYPAEVPEAEVREIKRIKARVESERLPNGADPARHLKLGRGSLSDVEWLVQLLQLQHAAEVPGLRTTSTLGALAAAQDAGLVSEPDAARLREAWMLASRLRSAQTLWSGRTSDLLPTDRGVLEGIARLVGYPPGSATDLEEDYLRITRQARQVFDRLFYG